MGWADKLGDKVQVDVKEWREAVKNKRWVGVITWDGGLNAILEDFLKMAFSRNDREVKKLFDCSIVHKARLAYALGLIDKTTLDDLKHIHDIRNIFAHTLNASFANDKVLKKCEGLSTVTKNRSGRKVNVTTSNSYKFYEAAIDKCAETLFHGISLKEQSL